MAENNNVEYKALLNRLEFEIQRLNDANLRQQDSLAALRGVVGKLQSLEDELSSKEQIISSDIKQQIIKEKINTVFRGEKVQDRLWFRSSRLDSIPNFVPISERPKGDNGVSTRFISFINFKGGVGKTTLVANLGAAFAAGLYDPPSKFKATPLRVLLVDLDSQGTLSDRCVDQELIRLADSGTDKYKNVTALLTSQPRVKLSQLTFPVIGSENARIICSGDRLDAKDSETFVKLAFGTVDTRFYFHSWFHKLESLKQFDLVVFDCPPRVSVSSVCALAVSDYAFIPTAPDLFDQAPIERTRTFILRLCETLNAPCLIGGVILNRTHSKSHLTNKEINFLSRIKVLSEDNREDFPVLKTYIPKRSGDKDSIIGDFGEPLPGGNHDRPFPFINDLASEIYARIYQ